MSHCRSKAPSRNHITVEQVSTWNHRLRRLGNGSALRSDGLWREGYCERQSITGERKPRHQFIKVYNADVCG